VSYPMPGWSRSRCHALCAGEPGARSASVASAMSMSRGMARSSVESCVPVWPSRRSSAAAVGTVTDRVALRSGPRQLPRRRLLGGHLHRPEPRIDFLRTQRPLEGGPCRSSGAGPRRSPPRLRGHGAVPQKDGEDRARTPAAPGQTGRQAVLAATSSPSHRSHWGNAAFGQQRGVTMRG
jgi:hypothetical protein